MERYEVIAPTLMAGRYLVPKVHMPDGGFRGLSIVDMEVDNGRVYAVSIMPFSEEIPHTVQIDTPLHLRPHPTKNVNAGAVCFRGNFAS